MEVVVFKSAHVGEHIFLFKAAGAAGKAIDEIALVTRTIGVNSYAFAVPETVFELPLIVLAIGPDLLALSDNLIFVPLAFVRVPALEYLFPATMLLIVFPLAEVVVAGLRAHKMAVPVGHVVPPPAFEDRAVVYYENAFAVADVLTFNPLSYINLILLQVHRAVLQLVADDDAALLTTVVEAGGLLY